jgi:uncharacterized protein
MLRRKKLEFDHMKFEPDTNDGVNTITRHESQRIWVGRTPYDASVLVPWSGTVLPWAAAAVSDLTPAHFARCLDLRPELVIFGSGARLQFVAPALYRALIERRIGIETMDTAAACRTFNVLANEGRSVVAVLLVGG